MARLRLSPEQRSAQLLDLGERLFATIPYDEVHIEKVAELAGVSRGLLYHYFPGKRAFFAALVRRHSEKLVAETAPDPSLPPYEQLARGVEVYLDHVARNPLGTRAMMRALASADAEMTRLTASTEHLQATRILAALTPDDGEPPALLRIAVRNWVVFIRNAAHDWLDEPDVPRDELRDLALSAFVGILRGLPVASRPAGLDDLLASVEAYAG
ncbi:TetR/AcrR family transcriptional regulator [Nocardioides massiliensis]|uniref:AcrR family transcriptional regulator n=1 Tax=Nocardioides massiliensis TaxID=1325935 RepID=A0ABT9NKH9_9ACTN|nr:TetR/AcrR family transcriptional regulator [Nocardioides massiliensis]MDP9820355.1 AcrR family transcriptional regulator [Nocardioides massiliensis]